MPGILTNFSVWDIICLRIKFYKYKESKNDYTQQMDTGKESEISPQSEKVLSQEFAKEDIHSSDNVTNMSECI